MPFGDEIAVLDGLDLGGLGMTMSIEDGRIGRTPATGAEYARQVSHNVQFRKNVIDPSEGANYGGGSSYAAGLPLLPSTVGLAEADLVEYSKVTNVLPPRRNVIDPGGGALYSGGSSHYPGGPLVVSGDPGLADARPLIQGGYGRPGLGDSRPLIQGGYGRPGLGECGGECAPLEALDGFFGSTMEIEDGRIGRTPATGSEYARQVSHNVQYRKNVIDASEGALYSGGSSYAPGLPLLPSTVGLAGLSQLDGLDGISDKALLGQFTPALPVRGVMRRVSPAKFKQVAGRARLRRLKGKAKKIARGFRKMSALQKQKAKIKLARIGQEIMRIRALRRAAAMSVEQRKRMGTRKAIMAAQRVVRAA